MACDSERSGDPSHVGAPAKAGFGVEPTSTVAETKVASIARVVFIVCPNTFCNPYGLVARPPPFGGKSQK